MKANKSILKSLSLLLGALVLFSACKNNLNTKKITDEAYIVFGNNSVSRAVKAQYKLSDFTSFQLRGYAGEIVPDLDEDDFVTLGTWSTYIEMSKSYIPLTQTGSWIFILEAKKGNTKFAKDAITYIVDGPNSLSFELEPVVYGLEGKGNVEVSLLLESVPFEVTKTETSYTVALPSISVSTTCATNSNLEKNLTLELLPAYNAFDRALSDTERYGTFTGTRTFTGNFLATLSETDIPAGEYIITYHISSDELSDIKTQSVVVVITDGKTATDKAAVSFTNAELLSAIESGEYKINYNKNGGTWSSGYSAPGSYSVYKDEDVTLPASDNLSKKGYLFKGWYTTADFSDEAITTIYGKGVDGGNKDLYAKWEIINYSINLEVGEGTGVEETELTYTVEQTFSLPNPTATTDGYEFKGWFDSENNRYTYISMGTTGNLSLTAKYGVISHKIIYNTDEGTLPVNYNWEFLDQTEPVELSVPVRPGYKFEGWYTTEDFDAETEITEIAVSVDTDVEVWAKWSLIEYTITYNLAGGTFDDEPAATYTYESSSITLELPGRAGYDFVGWYTTEDFTAESQITEIAANSYGNVTLYANWAQKCYTITYVTNGGTMPIEYPVMFSGVVDVDISGVIPTHGVRDFEGWCTSADCDASSITNVIKAGTKRNITLYAKFSTKIKWVVESKGENYFFVQNGDDWSSNNQGINSSTAITVWSITVPEDMNVTISYSVCSESIRYDYLSIYLDENEEPSIVNGGRKDDDSPITGSYDWALTAGKHYLKATYRKDGSQSDGTDTAIVTLRPINLD